MDGFFGSTLKYCVFVTNLIVFLLGLIMFGCGIYALATDIGLSSLIDEKTYENLTSQSPEIFLVVISGAVVVVAFLGCCGAAKENRLMIFIYFVIMLLVSVLTVFGATLVFSQNIDKLEKPLLESMKKYNHDTTDENTKEITQAWDQVQKEFLCCGVLDYGDWTQSNMSTKFPDAEGNFVPASCCTSVEDVDDCRKYPDQDKFESRLSGCFAQFEQSYKKHERSIGIVTLIIIAVMVVNLIALFGLALCINSRHGYEAV